MLERGRANVRESSSSSSSSSSVWTIFPLLFFTFSEREKSLKWKKKRKRNVAKRREKKEVSIAASHHHLQHTQIPSERAIFTTIATARRTARCESTRRVRFFSRARFTHTHTLSFSACVCSVLRWPIGSFFLLENGRRKIKNQSHSRNNALVTKINQRRRLSLRLFVHDDIDAFPPR